MSSALELSLVINTASAVICEAFQCNLLQSVFFSQWYCSQHQCKSHNWTHVEVCSDSFEWYDYDCYYKQIVQEKAT